MKEEFLKVDVLGNLSINEIFFFYEEPQIFTCSNKFGQVYLGLLIDMDNKKWLFLPISSSRLALLKSNRLSIKTALLTSEDSFLWEVEKTDSSSLAKAYQIYCNDIFEGDLPDDDVYLDYTEDELMPVLSGEIATIALEERRDIIDLSFLPLNRHTREIECEVLGEALVNTQQLIYSLGLPKDYTGNRISSKIKKDNSVVATGTQAASFGIRFKSIELADIYGETSLSPTIKLFAELLYAKDNETELKNLLRRYNPKTTIRYKKLMQGLLKADLSIKFSLASPDKYSFKTEFNKQDIANNIKFLQDEIDNMVTEEKLYGTMVGINVDKKTFAFKSVDEDNIIGNLADNFNGVTFEVPKYVEAIFEKKVSWNDLKQCEKYAYKLVSINDNFSNDNNKNT